MNGQQASVAGASAACRNREATASPAEPARAISFPWRRWAAVLLLGLASLGGARAAVTLEPWEQKLPINSVVCSACRGKTGFLQFTNPTTCRVAFYLNENTCTVTNAAWSYSIIADAYAYTDGYDGCDETGNYASSGPQNGSDTNQYTALQIQYVDWDSGNVYSNYYNGLYTDRTYSFDGCNHTNYCTDTCDQEYSYNASMDWTSFCLVTATLSDTGWSEVSTNYGNYFCYYDSESQCTNSWVSSSSCGGPYSSAAAVLQVQDAYPAVQCVLWPTQMVYCVSPAPTNGWACTTNTLTNEFTTALLKTKTLSELALLAFNGPYLTTNCWGVAGFPTSITNASCYLGSCETNLTLSNVPVLLCLRNGDQPDLSSPQGVQCPAQRRL